MLEEFKTERDSDGNLTVAEYERILANIEITEEEIWEDLNSGRD